MAITVKNLIILLVVVAVGAWAYMTYGPKFEAKDFKPDLYQQAEGYFTLGKFDMAIPAIEAALKSDPKDPRAEKLMFWYARAIDQDKRTDPTGQKDQALAAFKKFIAAYPKNPNVEKAKERIDQLEALGAK